MSLVVHYTRAIDEEDTLHEGNVLPDLCLSGHRSCFADLRVHSLGQCRQEWVFGTCLY